MAAVIAVIDEETFDDHLASMNPSHHYNKVHSRTIMDNFT